MYMEQIAGQGFASGFVFVSVVALFAVVIRAFIDWVLMS